MVYRPSRSCRGAPDVILMDIRMPRLDGIAATARLRARADPIPILVVTTFGEDEMLWGALEAGPPASCSRTARGRADRGRTRGRRRRRVVRSRRRPRVLERYRTVVAPAARDEARLERLTEREHAVLRLMARGATNSEIAASLYVAEATVKTHVGSIFTKLEVRDRAAAIVFAYDHGVVSPGATPPPRAV